MSLFPLTVYVVCVWERDGDSKFIFFFFSLFCDGLIGIAEETISKGTDCRQRSVKCSFLKSQKRNT